MDIKSYLPEKFAKILHSVTFHCKSLCTNTLQAVTEDFTLSLSVTHYLSR